jgi:hypothetical protein
MAIRFPKRYAYPLTGYVEAIPVSGDFRDAHNIFAVVSSSPTKKKSIAYHITKENGNATYFVAFIKMLIVSGYFEHYDILVMDNARIHTAGEAECVEYYLWNTLCDGIPLHVKIHVPSAHGQSSIISISNLGSNRSGSSSVSWSHI